MPAACGALAWVALASYRALRPRGKAARGRAAARWRSLPPRRRGAFVALPVGSATEFLAPGDSTTRAKQLACAALRLKHVPRARTVRPARSACCARSRSRAGSRCHPPQAPGLYSRRGPAVRGVAARRLRAKSQRVRDISQDAKYTSCFPPCPLAEWVMARHGACAAPTE